MVAPVVSVMEEIILALLTLTFHCLDNMLTHGYTDLINKLSIMLTTRSWNVGKLARRWVYGYKRVVDTPDGGVA